MRIRVSVLWLGVEYSCKCVLRSGDGRTVVTAVFSPVVEVVSLAYLDWYVQSYVKPGMYCIDKNSRTAIPRVQYIYLTPRNCLKCPINTFMVLMEIF